MSTNNPKLTKATTDVGMGSGSVTHSNFEGQGSRDTSRDLELEIALLKEENEKLRNQAHTDEGTNRLVALLAEAIKGGQPQAQPQQVGPGVDVNRSVDFRNTRATVDGRSLMEQQAALQNFRGEAKKPISIPKSFQSSVGPNLSITVNGIRVSIPCDGKTYYINETHWEHAKERIAKVDILNTIPDDVQEITA